MTALSHLDKNGRLIQVGDRVREYGGDMTKGPDGDPTTETFEVLIVEGPCPGSRSTADGWGTCYLADDGPMGNRVVEARFLEVVATASGVCIDCGTNPDGGVCADADGVHRCRGCSWGRYSPRNRADRTAQSSRSANIRYQLELEHADGDHSEPETVNRFCPSCAREYFGPDAEPDEPGDVGALFGGYRWNAAIAQRELDAGRPKPSRPEPASWCGCESAWCDHHGGNARTRAASDFPACGPCDGAPTGRFSMDFIGDVCGKCAAVPENGDVVFDHETGSYLATARRLDAR